MHCLQVWAGLDHFLQEETEAGLLTGQFIQMKPEMPLCISVPGVPWSHCSVSWARADLLGLCQCHLGAHAREPQGIFCSCGSDPPEGAGAAVSPPEAGLALRRALGELGPFGAQPGVGDTELFRSLFREGY